ncbi:MAG TPA: phosphoribosylamine--glycine ligase [Micromonosporaceae bacterium]|nr:phosphoribosylamine--glycine ligase [Micromonosporaceae bacterium]
MRVILLGSGGREHALAIALAADPSVTTLVCAPGNPGIAGVRLSSSGEPARLHAVDPADTGAVATLAREERADLVVVGPEAPLVAGVADAVREAGVACFGPSAAAARLEGSKAFAKDIMRVAGVPTASARDCATLDDCTAALDTFGPPYVVKDDGLAAGKGVAVTADRAAALGHAAAVLAGGHRVVVEQFLDGPEVSLFVVTDGQAAVPLLPAQDFKRVGDGDTGPNTGGMGAYAPLPWAPESLVDDVMAAVVTPTLAEMARRGSPFVGLLYVGLALTGTGPRVVEFNCRFGDPETQVVLALLETPLAGVLHAAATGTLSTVPPLRWREGAAVTVVVAAEGYPVAPRTGDVITGADRPGIIHAGTARGAFGGALLSAGGRVLCATGTGRSLAEARDAAYALVGGVHLAGSQHRSDIAAAALAGEVRLP